MRQRLMWFVLVPVLCLSGILLVSNWWVNYSTRGFLYQDMEDLPENHVALVLGTSKYLHNGNINLYFKYRMEAAVLLYKAGKVKYLLVSGDNREKNYNEPEKMRQELIRRGIPKERIILDFAGFRTLDSVIRSQKVFKQDSLTIVSQAFHNRRALYIARYYGIHAVAFNAKNVGLHYGFATILRELMARVKMFIDLYVSHTTPYFLGKPIIIPG